MLKHTLNIRFFYLKKIRVSILVLFLFNFVISGLKSQNHALDSLIHSLRIKQHDTLRCEKLKNIILYEGNENWAFYNDSMLNICLRKLKEGLKKQEIRAFKLFLAEAYNNIGYDLREKGELLKAISYYSKSVQLCREVNQLNDMAGYMTNLASAYNHIGQSLKALKVYSGCLTITQELGIKMEEATVLNNMAMIYHNQGKITEAIQYYEKALIIMESLNNQAGQSSIFTNLAFIFKEQGDIEKGFEYFKKALRINEINKDKRALAISLNNIGLMYYEVKDFDKAKVYFEQALKINQELNNNEGIARAYNNLAGILIAKEKYLEALDLQYKTLQIRKSNQDKKGQATVLKNMAGVYKSLSLMTTKDKKLRHKYYDLAIQFGKEAFEISKDLKIPALISGSSYNLYELYAGKLEYKKALEHYELYIQMRDSVQNERNRKASIKNQLKYEYEKQAAADSVAHEKESEIKNAEIAKQTAEIKAKKNQQYGLFGGLILVIIFAGFMYNRFKVTQKQKLIIENQKSEVENQKHLVEEKQREILDSIRYAKRIQQAHLPNEKYITKSLNKLRNNS